MNPGPLTRVAAADFDLALTLDSGQTFHWEKAGAGFAGTICDTAVYVEPTGETLLVSAPAAALVECYFALDHPLAEIRASFPLDPAMDAASEFCRGLRILRQPRWECLATFITSSMKQVAHIAQISRTLRTRFGNALPLGDFHVNSYPSPARMAELSEADLRDCALGYRAKNLLATARLVATSQVDLEALDALDDAALLAALGALPGVGPKIANCVLLFAYGRLSAFPIDVWIERVLRATYFARKRKVTPERLRLFAATYFGPYGGYAQQYLFHHARKSSLLLRQARAPAPGGKCAGDSLQASAGDSLYSLLGNKEARSATKSSIAFSVVAHEHMRR